MLQALFRSLGKPRRCRHNSAMSTVSPAYELHSDKLSLVLDCVGGTPVIAYFGTRLSGDGVTEQLRIAATSQEAQARTHNEPPIALSPEFGVGFTGNAGIQVHRNGTAWGVAAKLVNVDNADNTLTLTSVCNNTQLRIVHRLQLTPHSNVLVVSTEISNEGANALSVDQCNAPTVPLPLHCDMITGFEGRWALEFQRHTVPRFLGSYVRENRSGRTSHDSFPGVVVHTSNATEVTGEAYFFHLGWSGNHRLRVEEQSTGRAFAQLGELFYPGELSLQPGETYRSPDLFATYSVNGFGAASRNLHRFVRRDLTSAHMQGKDKLVHFNTWEAMYFDLSLERLCALADQAAAIGAERFVLDDGWFRHRKADNAGLGDWYVADDVFPDGLHPLTRYVNELGMEFGLWLEPEMVNPDSDLYRAHPDWVLSAGAAPQQQSRHQLVLDLTRTEVVEYLFERIEALLNEYPITYLKWDMNRDLSQPGDTAGRAAVHRQTHAVYALLERVRSAHPNLEIESCSSGGGRADYGVLRHTDRIWTSDSNDALDRLKIQEGFSYFFPAEIMGAHVGPYECHITGRKLSMALRAGVAMFGDMGVEANLLDMSDADKEELTAAIALHKRFRSLIFNGDLFRIDLESHEHGFGIVAVDQSEALFSYALLASQPHSAPGRYRFAGLDADTDYEMSIIWPREPKSYSPSIIEAIGGQRVSGDVLMHAGVQLPILHPASVLVFHLKS